MLVVILTLMMLTKLMVMVLVMVAVVDRELLCGGSGREIDL
jgi:hypothetical protein